MIAVDPWLSDEHAQNSKSGLDVLNCLNFVVGLSK